MTPGERWTVKDIAAHAGVTGAAVSNWRRRFADSFPKSGPDGLFDPEEVEAWLARTGRGPQKSDPSPRRDLTDSPRSLSVMLLKYLRAADVDGMDALALAAGLIAIRGLGGDFDATRGDPGLLERQLALPPGCLRIALAPAAHLAPSAIEAATVAVRGAVRDRRTGVAALRDLLQAGPTSRAAAEHVSTLRLSRFLAEALPRASKSLLDPACGTGGLLIGAARRLGPERVAGYEIDPQTWAIAVLHCALLGLDADIRRADFFAAGSGRFETVVAQPPLGDRVSLGRLGEAAMPDWSGNWSQDPADVGWLLACYLALAPGGTAYVLTSAGMTFSRSLSDARRDLIRKGAVLAVVSMPPGTVADSSVPASLWVLRRQPEPRPGVLLVDASSRKDLLLEAAHQVGIWCGPTPERLKPIPGLSRVVPLLDLVGGRAELAPSSWTAVPTARREAMRDARATLHALQQAADGLQQAALPPLDLVAGPARDLVTLAELVRQERLMIHRPRQITTGQLEPDGALPYAARVGPNGLQVTGRLREAPAGAVVTRPGDLALSTIAPLRAAVDHEGGHVLGSSLWLIRPLTDDPALHPDLLTMLLANPRIAARAVGSTVRRLRDPADVEIPLLSRADAETLLGWVQRAAAAERAARNLLDAKAAAIREVSAALDSGARPRM
jgi:hypothetical protein